MTITEKDMAGVSIDWSGVPETVTFDRGTTSLSFTVTAVDDTVEDDDEMVELGLGTPIEREGIVVVPRPPPLSLS